MQNNLIREHFTVLGTPKRVYKTEEEAIQSAFYLEGFMEAYQCTFCNNWHVGNSGR